MGFWDLFKPKTWRAPASEPQPPAPPPPPPPMPAPRPAPPVGAMSRFEQCLRIVLEHEGGFANDPQDPGGATMMGITRATLAEWRGRPVTAAEVRALTRQEAMEIYRARYWNILRCDDLPPGIDLMVFDFGVNAGPRAGARMLQRAVAVPSDGAIGPITLRAARSVDAATAIDRMAALRREHYVSLPTFPRFGRGWLRRTEEVRDEAHAMAAAAALAGR